MRSQSPRSPEQTNPRHIFSVAAGHDAAEAWLTNTPCISAGAYRDLCFLAHASGVCFSHMVERRAAFNQAFAQTIAEAIVRGEAYISVEAHHG